MRADLLILIVVAIFALGYFLYSRFLARKVFNLDDSKPTPAYTLNDGIDYVPTRKHILFGHHFASIAGAAPIVGPCIACYWGWIPALLWVVLGGVFMGAVHDMGALILSVRNKAESIGSTASKLINKKSKFLFLSIIFFMVWLLSAAFAVIIARLFVEYPAVVIPVNIAILVALVLGYLFYKLKVQILFPSIIALIVLYASIPLGIEFPVDLGLIFGFSGELAMAFWIIFLLVYGFVASVLPVWVLLQPRDYINSHQLVIGLLVLISGIFIAQPVIVAPGFNYSSSDAPSCFPFLFVTIACGAVSGFHGLVSSGTSSKQLNRETDARSIAYGGMLLESTLALLALIAAAAGFSNKIEWSEHYSSWAFASKHGLEAFVQGSANFLSKLGLDQQVGMVFVVLIVISFAATTLDTAFRIQRFIVAEIAEDFEVKTLSNRFLASALAVVSAGVLIFSDSSNIGQGAFTLWPVFGTSNQLLAGITLLLLSIYLVKFHESKPYYLCTLLPAVFLILLTSISAFLNMAKFWIEGKYVLAIVLLLMLIILSLILFYSKPKRVF